MKIKLLIWITICILVFFTLCGCTTIKKAKEDAENIVQSYNSKIIDYDTALRNLESIEMDKQEVAEYVNETILYLEELRNSKNNYNKAEKLFSNKKYGEAVIYYEKVLADDMNYNDAQNKITDSKKEFIELTIDEAESYVKDEEYLKAINLYKNAIKTYDDGTMNEKIIELESKYKDLLEIKAEDYVKDKKWSEAIDMYEELENYFNDDSYSVKITQTQNEYISEAISKAEMYTKNGDYDTAKNEINNAIRIIGYDAELNDELDRIISFEPLLITELDEFYKDGNVHKWAGIDKDNTGTSYPSGLLVNESGGYMFSGPASSEIEYLLDGKYDRMTGKVVLHYDCKDIADESVAAGQIKIYGDGELLYSSDVVASGVMPQDFNLNISGVNRLKIEFLWILTPYGFDMGQIKFGVVNPIVQKNYTKKNKWIIQDERCNNE